MNGRFAPVVDIFTLNLNSTETFHIDESSRISQSKPSRVSLGGRAGRIYRANDEPNYLMASFFLQLPTVVREMGVSILTLQTCGSFKAGPVPRGEVGFKRNSCRTEHNCMLRWLDTQKGRSTTTANKLKTAERLRGAPLQDEILQQSDLPVILNITSSGTGLRETLTKAVSQCVGACERQTSSNHSSLQIFNRYEQTQRVNTARRVSSELVARLWENMLHNGLNGGFYFPPEGRSVPGPSLSCRPCQDFHSSSRRERERAAETPAGLQNASSNIQFRISAASAMMYQLLLTAAARSYYGT